MYRISNPDCVIGGGFLQAIDIFGTSDADPDRLDMEAAWNGLNDNRPSNVKLSLRDLILGFWKLIGRNPKDLKQIRYQSVVEDGMTVVTPEVFEALNRPLRNIALRQGGKSIGEQQAFELLNL